MTTAKKKAVVKSVPRPKTTAMVNEPVHPANMIQALMARPDVDLDQVSKMFELQERFDANVARKAYHKAIAHFGSICPQIVYDSWVDYGDTHFGFASLAGTLSKIQDACAESGLKISWKTNNGEGQLVEVTCFLTHELGHSESTSLSATPDTSGGKNSIQGVRSTWSYLRRMTAESLLGLATKADDSDDGKDAGETVAVDKPTMDDEAFADTKKKFEQVVLSGKGTPAGLIAKLSTKYTLTEQQIQVINNMEQTNGDS